MGGRNADNAPTRYGPVWCSKPCRGQVLLTRPDWTQGPPNLLHNGYRVSCDGKKTGGVVLTTHSIIISCFKCTFFYFSAILDQFKEYTRDLIISLYVQTATHTRGNPIIPGIVKEKCIDNIRTSLKL